MAGIKKTGWKTGMGFKGRGNVKRQPFTARDGKFAETKLDLQPKLRLVALCRGGVGTTRGLQTKTRGRKKTRKGQKD